LEKPGSEDCDLTIAPCGSRSTSQPVIYAEAGSNFTFVFMKNLDHFYPQNPGNFSVLWAENVNKPFKLLGSTKDTSAPSLSLYYIQAELPNTPIKHGIVQVVYFTQNPGAPAAFFQCADMGIF